jgi:hypothetical protein
LSAAKSGTGGAALPDGQFAHARYALFARRVEMPHPVGIDPNRKSDPH